MFGGRVCFPSASRFSRAFSLPDPAPCPPCCFSLRLLQPCPLLLGYSPCPLLPLPPPFPAPLLFLAVFLPRPPPPPPALLPTISSPGPLLCFSNFFSLALPGCLCFSVCLSPPPQPSPALSLSTPHPCTLGTLTEAAYRTAAGEVRVRTGWVYIPGEPRPGPPKPCQGLCRGWANPTLEACPPPTPGPQVLEFWGEHTLEASSQGADPGPPHIDLVTSRLLSPRLSHGVTALPT